MVCPKGIKTMCFCCTEKDCQYYEDEVPDWWNELEDYILNGKDEKQNEHRRRDQEAAENPQNEH